MLQAPATWHLQGVGTGMCPEMEVGGGVCQGWEGALTPPSEDTGQMQVGFHCFVTLVDRNCGPFLWDLRFWSRSVWSYGHLPFPSAPAELCLVTRSRCWTLLCPPAFVKT